MEPTTFEDDFSEEIFNQTYTYNGETVNDVHRRVAKDLASVEKTEELKESCYKEFLWALENFKFVPGGRILSNAGVNLRGTTYINCFVSGPDGEDIDSLNGILRELKNQALILKSEGGYGFCANFMRPKGAYIFGIANEGPGAIVNLEMWDKQAEVITSGSGKVSTKVGAKSKIRKGAQMVTMSVWHPDIENFITAKQTPGKLTKFNMSVLITDSFMKAIKNNEPWNLEFPDYENHMEQYKKCWNGNIDEWKRLNFPTKVYKTYSDANELWDIIMKSTYNRNEPGVLFVDTINKMNNLYYTEHINATNPCVTGDTLVKTYDNKTQNFEWVKVKDLVGKEFTSVTWGKKHYSSPEGFWLVGTRPCYSLKFRDRSRVNDSIKEVLATNDHKFLTNDDNDWVNEWMTVGQIENKLKRNYKGLKLISAGDLIEKQFLEIISVEPIGVRNVYDCTIPGVHYYNANGLVSHNCGEQVLPIGGVCLLGSINLTQFVNEDHTDFDYPKLKKLIPIAVRLLDNVNDRTLVPLETQRKNLKDKRRIGLGIMGYGSALMMLKIKYGSDKALQKTEELMTVISETAYQSSALLASEKGAFELYSEEHYLQSKFIRLLSEETKDMIKENGIRNSHLLSVQPTGNTAVCSNNVSGGLEPLFMTEYTRTSIFQDPPEGMNLPKSVDWVSMKHNTSPGPIEWECVKEGDEQLFRSSTEYAGYIWKYDKSRGLLRETKVKDYSLRQLQKTNEWDPNADWAATAMSLEVKDHIETMRVISRYIDSAMSKCIAADTILETNKGEITIEDLCDKNRTMKPDTFRIPGPEEEYFIKDRYNKSKKITQFYYGGYKSCKKVTFEDGFELVAADTHKLQSAIGWSRVDELVPGEMIYKWDNETDRICIVKVVSIENIGTEKIYDIEVEDTHTYLINGIVSHNTINVPNDYPYSDFKDIYKMAYETGTIKGVTSYRTGTMTFVLSETKEKSKKPPSKRPLELECDINVICTNKGRDNWVVLVGILDNKPYEVFSVKQNNIRISNKVTHGKLVKCNSPGPRSTYNLVTDYFCIDDLKSHFESDEQAALTRVISIALRNGTCLDDIYHQLISCEGTVGSFAKSIARTLSKYVTSIRETECPECKDPNGILFQEGCLKCKNCSFSKCL